MKSGRLIGSNQNPVGFVIDAVLKNDVRSKTLSLFIFVKFLHSCSDFLSANHSEGPFTPFESKALHPSR